MTNRREIDRVQPVIQSFLVTVRRFKHPLVCRSHSRGVTAIFRVEIDNQKKMQINKVFFGTRWYVVGQLIPHLSKNLIRQVLSAAGQYRQMLDELSIDALYGKQEKFH